MLTKEIALGDDCIKGSAKNANKIQTINCQHLEQTILERFLLSKEINFHESCNILCFLLSVCIYTSESAQYLYSFGRKHEMKTKFYEQTHSEDVFVLQGMINCLNAKLSTFNWELSTKETRFEVETWLGQNQISLMITDCSRVLWCPLLRMAETMSDQSPLRWITIWNSSTAVWLLTGELLSIDLRNLFDQSSIVWILINLFNCQPTLIEANFGKLSQRLLSVNFKTNFIRFFDPWTKQKLCFLFKSSAVSTRKTN